MVDLDLPRDYEDLLRDFSECGVEFLLIGGWAVAVHGHGRATDVLDVLVHATPSNASRVIEALERYGAPLRSHEVTAELFSHERHGYRMGRKPLMIEVLTKIDGVDFATASEDAIIVDLRGVAVPVIGRAAVLANKRAAGRPKDLADVAALEHDG